MFRDKKAHERIDNLVRVADETIDRIAKIENGELRLPSGKPVTEIAEEVLRLGIKTAVMSDKLAYIPIPQSHTLDMAERQRKMSHDAMVFRIAALENMVTLLVGALGKEFVEEPEVPAVPAVPARIVVRDLPKAKR